MRTLFALALITLSANVAAADLNGDALPELVVANLGSSDVSVFVNDGRKPCLEVEKLNDRTGGRIGIWGGDGGSGGGHFANLKITPRKN